jgi:hypothetical protein
MELCTLYHKNVEAERTATHFVFGYRETEKETVDFSQQRTKHRGANDSTRAKKRLISFRVGNSYFYISRCIPMGISKGQQFGYALLLLYI